MNTRILIRLAIAAAAIALLALLGYGIWSAVPEKSGNNLPDPPQRAGSSFSVDLGNGVKLEMVNLPGGEFTMGSNDGFDTEKPPHRVKVSPFALGKYEVTQAQWKALMGNNPSAFKGSDELPVEQVSWDDAQEFLKRLRSKTGDQTWRLPSEAEWEYAARAGSTGKYSFGDDEGELGNYAWFSNNSGETHPVGQKQPNQFGLYDMNGNVSEWCADWYGGSYYSQSPTTDPPGPSSGSHRVGRGGSFNDTAAPCRSAFRNNPSPGSRSADRGFRLLSTSTKPATTEQPARDSRTTFTNGIGMAFVQIPAGTFGMGSDTSDCPRDEPSTERNEYQDCVNRMSNDEMTRHQVTISQAFWLGKYEVTQAEWYKVMGNNPSVFKSEKVGGDSRNYPVENVSWDDAQLFIRRLNGMEDASSYRLPTEAEWEYACRAGSTGDYAGDLNAMAWYGENAGNTTHPVGQKRPNAWGLYDMHGNVWEWVQDWYGENYYSQSPTTDPRGPSSGSGRVRRGGNWISTAAYCRAAYRSYYSPGGRGSLLGFRLMRTPK